MAKGSDGKGKRRSRGSGGQPLALATGRLAQAPVWQRALGRLTGARACYGKPIEAHGHVVIPVATLRTSGGLGFGRGSAVEDASAPTSAGAPGEAPPSSIGSGGGGGWHNDARPIGFIDVGPDGVRYQPIEVPATARSASTTALLALGILVASRGLRGPVARLTRRSAAGSWPVRSLRR